jgi:hypothetical protein
MYTQGCQSIEYNFRSWLLGKVSDQEIYKAVDNVVIELSHKDKIFLMGVIMALLVTPFVESMVYGYPGCWFLLRVKSYTICYRNSNF